MHKLINQFDLDWKASKPGQAPVEINEEIATLLYIIDIFNKNLLDIENHPVRKTREMLDDFAKELMQAESGQAERVLFRFRQFFSTYRIDEYTYMLKTFGEFRNIIWDFVDQLSEDVNFEKSADDDIKSSFEQLKEAVDSNSIDLLRTQSRVFIDSYVEHQSKKDKHRTDRLRNIKKNLDVVKKQLNEANSSMRLDHLTQAFNRKSFDEQLKQQKSLHLLSKQPVTMIALDIDHFKKVNDTYGHQTGDLILIECVRLLKEVFSRESDFVARIGGEEFAVILPECRYDHALKKAEQAIDRIREETYVVDDVKIKFTVSMGIAELSDGEEVESWLKRADQALYHSKTTGRNKYTLAEPPEKKNHAA